MAALTTIETQLINKSSPLDNQFSLGSRNRYLTTDGEFASGTLSGNVISSGTITNTDIQSNYLKTAVSTIQTTISTAFQLQGGKYAFRASAGALVRVSSSLTSGTLVSVTNLSTVASGIVELDTGGAGIGLNMGSFGATAGSSANLLTLSGMQTVELVLASGSWWALSGTGSLATFSTVRTGS